MNKLSEIVHSTHLVEWRNLVNKLDDLKDIDGNMTHFLLISPAYTLLKDDAAFREDIYIEVLDYKDRHILYWDVVSRSLLDDILAYYSRFFNVYFSWEMPYSWT